MEAHFFITLTFYQAASIPCRAPLRLRSGRASHPPCTVRMVQGEPFPNRERNSVEVTAKAVLVW